MNVFVLGGGTLGRFAADIIAAAGEMTMAGFFDDRYPSINSIDGHPVIGAFKDVPRDAHLVIGVGEPKDRKRLFEEYRALGGMFPPIVHPTAVISARASIGDGVIVGPLSTVLGGSRVEDGCCLLSAVNINHDTTVHRWSLIGAGVSVGNGAVLGEGCHIGMRAVVRPAAVIDAWTYVA